jgi:hypothetical protein
MWLLETATLTLREFIGTEVPKYAILSHTWSGDEIKFHEVKSPNENVREKAGYRKVKRFVELVKSMGYEYAWADTACIDKRSSAELTEAINSMYIWYQAADVCIIYLEDVPPRAETLSQDAQLAALEASRWFTRGWTLQEILACANRHFHAQDWSRISLDEDSLHDLDSICSKVTGVSVGVLNDQRVLQEVTIAERMSWAARRKTTRPEDRAYSLLGIFDVNMPILYGEGLVKAFRRLQEEIMKSSFDQTLFAWRGHYYESGLLAYSPDDFAETPKLALLPVFGLESFSLTNIGVSIRLQVSSDTCPWLEFEPGFPNAQVHVAALQCVVRTGNSWGIPCIRIRRIQTGGLQTDEISDNGQVSSTWRRTSCNRWDIVPSELYQTFTKQGLVVLEDEHEWLMQTIFRHEADLYDDPREMKMLDTVVSLPLKDADSTREGVGS